MALEHKIESVTAIVLACVMAKTVNVSLSSVDERLNICTTNFGSKYQRNRLIDQVFGERQAVRCYIS